MQLSSDQYLKFFRHSSPYINAHRGQTFVLNLSGEALQDANFDNIVHDIALLNSLGIRLVIAFGARPQIDQRLQAAGVECLFHKELRLTSMEVLEHVKDAIGNLRIRIEALLSMGVANSPMHGARLRVISGNFITAKPLGVVDGIDYQQTGQVRRVDHEAISGLLDSGFVVLLSSTASSPTGEVFNLPVEDVATAAACALQARKLVLYSNEEGIREDDKILNQLSPAHAQRLAPELSKELQNLIKLSSHACANGVGRCHIVNHSRDGALLQELFTRDGGSTLITDEGYDDIRQASIGDVGGILELIQPLEEQGVLVRRSRKQIENEISQFTVAERDGMIIGCIALHIYDDAQCKSAELACVAVHHDYRAGNRGDQLLEKAEDFARGQGLEQLFVLTTQTTHWFKERGFLEVELERLPASKLADYNPQRNSKVLFKGL